MNPSQISKSKILKIINQKMERNFKFHWKSGDEEAVSESGAKAMNYMSDQIFNSPAF